MKRIKKIIKKLFKFCFWLGIIGVFAGSVGIACFFYLFSPFSDLPDHHSLQKYVPSVSSRVFLQDGSRLAEYSAEKRYFVPITKIPRKVINAFISAEDKHFFQHQGVDFQGIIRSVIKNLENLGTGKRPQGASTITQQVARIFLIKTNKVSYVRKLKEAILSYRIEQSLSKLQILELYLNQVYMGIGTYGVAAAAKAYFNKTLDELSIAECSYLASLVKGANNYHPIKYKKRAIKRRNWVIDRQLADGYISEVDAQQAKKEDLIMVQAVREKEQEEEADYFAEELRKYLMEKFPSDSLNKEGLIVRATLDSRFQKFARKALRSGLEAVDRRYAWRGPIGSVKAELNFSSAELIKYLRNFSKPKGAEEFLIAAVLSVSANKIIVLTEQRERGEIISEDINWIRQKIKRNDIILVKQSTSKNRKKIADKSAITFSVKQVPNVQGAIVVIEVETGRILAMQGGYSFSMSEFNRVTQAMRQCGSAFKPFVYLAGLENGFSPNTVIDASSVEIDLGESLGIWKPRNYHGMQLDNITMRRALERSINTATVRIAQETGLHKIAKIAEQFGIFDDMPEYFSYALGAGETTLLKLTTAYAMLANGGKRITPTMIDYVLDRYGNVLYKNDQRIVDNTIGFDAEFPPKLNDNREQILDERSIYQLTSMLEGVMQRGSGASARFLDFPMAGKTGTSNESRDTWFIGYTPDIAVGIYVGFDEQSKNLGKNANGTNTALPIFISFMKEAKRFLVPTPFRVPKGIKLRKIDAETGGTPTNVSKAIIEAFKDDEGEFREDFSIGNFQNDTTQKSKKRRNFLELIEENGEKNNNKQNNDCDDDNANQLDIKNHKHKNSDNNNQNVKDDEFEDTQIVTPITGIY